MSLDHQDTIAAVSTPFGEGAIAVVRVSGPTVRNIAKAALVPAPETPRLATLAHLVSAEGDQIDETLATFFSGPGSYTGEDLLEIGCHGGIHVTRRVLERILEAGARAANPGEFTERAFLNGKLDLTQAEAVMDLISAKSDLALRAAGEQLAGRLGEEMEILRGSLLGVTAHVEAYIDFPDEDIDPDTGAQLLGRLREIEGQLDQLLVTADEGRILREGLATAIVGQPNAGKSSLLNRLAGHDRAIVTEVPGTTRDTIEEFIVLRGIPLRLVDTAGLRETDDAVESKGIERTRRAISDADLVIEVVEGNQSPGVIERVEIPTGKPIPTLLVLNKTDLGIAPAWSKLGVENTVSISCEKGEGIDDLTAALETLIRDRAHLGHGQGIAINARHRDCLRRSRSALREAITGLDQARLPELVASDLREALHAVGEVTGRTDTETLLGEIFSSFCIGK